MANDINSSSWHIDDNLPIKQNDNNIVGDYNALRDRLYNDIKATFQSGQGGKAISRGQLYIKLCFEFIHSYNLMAEAVHDFVDIDYCNENIPINKTKGICVLSENELDDNRTTGNYIVYAGKKYYIAKDWYVRDVFKNNPTANNNKLALLLWIGEHLRNRMQWSRDLEISSYNLRKQESQVNEKFTKFIKKIRKFLEYNNVDISEIAYESSMIDALAKGDLFQTKKANGSDSQTHIAITGKAMDFFPYAVTWRAVNQNDYSDNRQYMVKIKGNMVLLPPDKEILSEEGIEYKDDFIPVEYNVCKIKHGSGIQVEMTNPSYSSNVITKIRRSLGEEYNEGENGWLLVLKRNNEFIYDLLFLRKTMIEKYDSAQDDETDKLLVDLNNQENNILNGRNVDFIDLSHDLEINKNKTIDQPHNRILYGAPGTGKSYTLKEDAKVFAAANMERVTFHPAYSYAQFFGSFKPISEQIGEKTDIAYKFVPGPFLRVLLKALANPSQNYLLVIEEINRANVAAVFGDVFQLLDRKNGESEYPIAISDELFNYITNDFNQQVQVEGYERAISIPRNDKKIKIPANMYIWATMNSADQGVQPMDTAFKRRWDFEYIKINDGESETNIDIKLELFDGNTQSFNWNELRHHINKILADNGVPEDKCLGPFFINKDTLKDNVKFKNAFENKVLMYLYEDAAQYCRGLMFSKQNDDFQFAELLKDFENKGVEVIFNFKATTNEQSEQSGDN